MGKANPDIGRCKCPFSGEYVPIRKSEGRGKYPLYLNTPLTGPMFFNTEQGQDWLLENGEFYGAEGPPLKETTPEPEPAMPEETPYKGKAEEIPYKEHDELEPEPEPEPLKEPEPEPIKEPSGWEPL